MNARMSVVIGIAASLLLVFFNQVICNAEENTESRHVAVAVIQELEQNITVILQRVYLDGDISEEIVTETAKSMDEVQEKYKNWMPIDEQENQIIFRNHVNDISPLLKANGFFGITEEGILTIFNGKPKNSKVIHSFFQIDVGRLESRKKQELKKGIPIKTKDRYEKVLETFKPYSKLEQ